MSLPPKKTVIQTLGEKGKITREQAVEATQRKQATTESLEAILLDMGIAESDVYEAQAGSMGVPFIDLDSITVDAEAKSLVPEDMRERYRAIPIRLDGKRLTVAMANPKDVFALDEMSLKTGLNVQPVMVPPSQLEALRNGSLNGTNGDGSQNGASPEAQESMAFDESIDEMLGMLAPVEKDPTKKRKEKNESSLQKLSTPKTPSKRTTSAR